MRGDFPQIGSFQGDKPRGVGNCVSRLFRQNHVAIEKIKIQMLAIKRFKAVVCLIWLIPMLDFWFSFGQLSESQSVEKLASLCHFLICSSQENHWPIFVKSCKRRSLCQEGFRSQLSSVISISNIWNIITNCDINILICSLNKQVGKQESNEGARKRQSFRLTNWAKSERH